MHPIHDLSIPKRRNLQPVRDALNGLAFGGPASAKFVSNRYGPFIIEGTVRESGGDLHIAGSFLGNARMPNSELHSLVVGEFPVSADGTFPAANLAHGDIIRAALRNAGHGAYWITGIALSSHDRPGLTLASWFLDHANVTGIELLEAASDHALAVPAVLGELESTPTVDSAQQ